MKKNNMVRTNKVSNSKTDNVKWVRDFYWLKNGRNFQLVDKDGNPVRVLPIISREVVTSFPGKEISYLAKEDGLHIWRPDHYHNEQIRAAIWGRQKETHTGLVPTEETIKTAKDYVAELTELYEKSKLQAKKDAFRCEFDRIFDERTQDRGISLYWKSDDAMKEWSTLMDNEKYICYNLCGTGKNFEGVVIKRSKLQEAKEGSNILSIKVPLEVMYIVRDSENMRMMKRELGLYFIRVKAA